MASAEEEYESDPEEEKRSLAMRRRQAASDDEEESDDRRAEDEEVVSESDGQGGFEEYDDDDEEEDEYDDEEEEEEEEGYDGKVAEEVGVGIRDGDGVDGVPSEVNGEEVKKENEPFAVPTAGAFYMHDDRFRDNARGRGRGGRRMRGGRGLWESRDEHKWGHDKFEELTTQERQYVERRGTSRGRYRGRGKSRGTGRGDMKDNRSRAYTNVNDQSQAPKSVRGRGPRRYVRTGNNCNQAVSTQNRQSGKSTEKNMRTSPVTAFQPSSNVGSDQDPARKQVFGSSLNSASPPFYPSGSSSKDMSMTQRDIHSAGNTGYIFPDATNDKLTLAQNNTCVRGKNVVDSVGVENLYINDSVKRPAGKTVNNMQVRHSGSTMATYSKTSRSHGRGVVNTGKMSYQPVQHHNQINKVSTSSEIYVQNRRNTPQQMGQRPGSRSQVSSPPKSAPSVNSSEAVAAESVSESNNSNNAIVGKGKIDVQGSGRGSFPYSGAPIIGTTGNVGVGHGDQNFSAAPTFLPVMQFGGQHPSGMGVPAFGMAFPGYVGGNSEMTWLPVLAGAAGALGGTYCPPQIAVDGSYHPRLAGQTSSVGSSNNESDTSKPNIELKPSEKDVCATDEVGQRQHKPRRYSEMNFGQ